MAERRGRMLWIIAAGAVGLYVVLCALLFWQQRSLVYFPQATRAEAAGTDIAVERPGAVLRGWVVNPGHRDALLYFGGNAESVQANRAAFAQRFPRHTVYLFAYRGYGASTGQPSEAALFADALALHDDIQRRHPAGRIVVVGRSLGSGVASHLASQRGIAKLVLVTPFDSLSAVARAHYPVFPVGLLLRDRYESIRYLPRHRGQLLVLRAGQDNVVPPRNTDRLLRALPRPPRVVDFPRDGHDTLSDDPDYWRAMRDFVEEATAQTPVAQSR